jgi:hypothetical protein
MLVRYLFLGLALVFSLSQASAQLSNITFLHNSADASLAEVDVYVTQYGQTTKLENLAYKGGTGFPDAIVFGGFEVTIDVAPASSASRSEAIATLAFTPAEYAGYQVEVQGVGSTNGFVPNPEGADIKLKMVKVLVPEPVPVNGEVAVMFSHGSTDLEACDVYVRGSSAPLFTNMRYGQITNITKNVKRLRQTIDLTKVGDKTKVLASFEADLALLSTETVIFTISGFKTPADNHQSDNGLALLAMLDDGNVVTYPLLSGSQKARVQVIHNSPDPALSVVDVWVNGERKVDNIAFRGATAFADFEAGSPVIIGITQATATNLNNPILLDTLEAFRPGRSYHVIVQGITDTTKFKPRAAEFLLQLNVADGALEKSATAGKTVVRTVHGVIDLPAVDVKSTNAEYATGITYSGVSPEYIPVEPVARDTFWVYDAASKKKLRGWVADMRGTDRAMVALISGFLGTDSNQNGPKWKIVLVDANGSTSDKLIEVDTGGTTGSVDLVPASLWTLAPNPASTKATLFIPFTETVAGVIGNGAQARVFSVSGELQLVVPTAMADDGLHASLHTASLSPGTYLINVVGSSGAVVGTAPLTIVR